jgi:hypothetical protein
LLLSGPVNCKSVLQGFDLLIVLIFVACGSVAGFFVFVACGFGWISGALMVSLTRLMLM